MKGYEAKYSTCKKFLNEHHWLIDICSKGSACRKKRATFHLFNFTCSVWGDLSMIKRNYSNVNQWASRHPETVISRHSQPCVNSIGYGTAVSWSKLRVMYAAKQPPKPLPSLAESLAVHRLISGTMDEQALRYLVCVSRFLLTPLLLLQSIGEMCFLFLLPSLYVSCFLLPFLPPT